MKDTYIIIGIVCFIFGLLLGVLLYNSLILAPPIYYCANQDIVNSLNLTINLS